MRSDSTPASAASPYSLAAARTSSRWVSASVRSACSAARRRRPGFPNAAGISARAAKAGWRCSHVSAVARTVRVRLSQSAIWRAISTLANGMRKGAADTGCFFATCHSAGSASCSYRATNFGSHRSGSYGYRGRQLATHSRGMSAGASRKKSSSRYGDNVPVRYCAAYFSQFSRTSSRMVGRLVSQDSCSPGSHTSSVPLGGVRSETTGAFSVECFPRHGGLTSTDGRESAGANGTSVWWPPRASAVTCAR